jgi:phage gp36-like protein
MNYGTLFINTYTPIVLKYCDINVYRLIKNYVSNFTIYRYKHNLLE